MGEQVYTVTEITRIIKKRLEDDPQFSSIWIKGELSNVTYHSSGHIYLTLKDEGAIIQSAFFRYANKNLSFRLEEGMSVLALGSLSVFEKRGSYQLIIQQIRLEGVGELLKRIEQLKKKLLAEGVFDPSRKRPVPFLPRRIGVATSPTGAALRDIIKVAMRRYPNIEILLAPARVQGRGAEASIVTAIEELNRPQWGVDVIICGRGGGSFEDLMPFNEESVVRAFRGSRVPIISAVGHQIDHPLCDDAADYAAPTPSAAAEYAVPMKKDLDDEIEYLFLRAGNALASSMRHRKIIIEGILGRRCFRNPREIVDARELTLSDLENTILSSMREAMFAARKKLLVLPDLNRSMSALMREKSHLLDNVQGAIENLSPLGILKRGYAIALDSRGRSMASVGRAKTGDSMRVMLRDGSLDCSVKSIKRGAPFGKKTGLKG